MLGFFAHIADVLMLRFGGALLKDPETHLHSGKR